jgi:hypothetical protein
MNDSRNIIYQSEIENLIIKLKNNNKRFYDDYKLCGDDNIQKKTKNMWRPVVAYERRFEIMQKLINQNLNHYSARGIWDQKIIQSQYWGIRFIDVKEYCNIKNIENE